MQTFLPNKNFDIVANVLDSKRLNKQILEAYQILNVLSNDDPHAGWRNHPAVKMWKGHEIALFDYAFTMIREANFRGIKTDKNKDNLIQLRVKNISKWGSGFPDWYQNSEVMNFITATHKANLYYKDPEFYYFFESFTNNKYNKPCCPTCKYYWVTHVK